MEDEEVLSYDKVVLRRSDVDLLKGPHYLNDCLIEFYFRYLSNNDEHECCSKNNDILLVPPTLSFWLANSCDPDCFKDFEESHEVLKKQIIIFTVNNNENVSLNDGGTHWSLLVYYRKSNTFVHYDSLGDFNVRVAWKLYRALDKHINMIAPHHHHDDNNDVVATTDHLNTAISSSSSSPSPSPSVSPTNTITSTTSTSSDEDTACALSTVDMDELLRSRSYHRYPRMKKRPVLPKMDTKRATILKRRPSLYPRQRGPRPRPTRSCNIISDDDNGDEAKALGSYWPGGFHYYNRYDYLRNNIFSSESDAANFYHVDDDDDDRKRNAGGFKKYSDTPRQTNCYDCGLYVMAIARVICQWYCAANSSSSSSTGTATCTTSTTEVEQQQEEQEEDLLPLLQLNDNDDDGGGQEARRFPDIKNHVDSTSLESTMRSELLALIQQLQSHSTPTPTLSTDSEHHHHRQPIHPQPQPQPQSHQPQLQPQQSDTTNNVCDNTHEDN